MSAFDIILTGVALSMDAAAVSMTDSMVHRDKPLRLLEMAFWFGFFQGLMPVLGFSLGHAFHDVIAWMGKYLVAAIFCLIGGKMVQEAFSNSHEESAVRELSHRLLLIQAFATSVDAFAIGVGFSAGGADIFSAAAMIAATTFIISLAAVATGRVFGNILGKKAELFGGALLIFLGARSLL